MNRIHPRARTGLLIAALVAAITGCTRVTVTGADGATVSNTRFGVVSVNANPSQVPQIVTVEGFGVMSENGGVTVGYRSSQLVALPVDDCRAVLFVEPGTSETLIEQFKTSLPGACVVEK